MWERGWDEEYGGLFYFRDLRGLPVQEYWHDMKFWWPHNEAIIATLLAWKLTGDAKYARWHRLVHDWSFQHFPDPEYGEWYGYLHRDGSVSSASKATVQGAIPSAADAVVLGSGLCHKEECIEVRHLRTTIVFTWAILTIMTTQLYPAEPTLEWRHFPRPPTRMALPASSRARVAALSLSPVARTSREKTPMEGGRKVWYDTAYVLDRTNGPWRAVSKLPRPLGYGVSVTTQRV